MPPIQFSLTGCNLTTDATTIDHASLTRLVQEKAISDAQVIGRPGGWGVAVRNGDAEQMLAARRGAVRVFRKFETLASYLKEIGIVDYRVNARDFDPVSLATGRKRTDSAARMKGAHMAAAYVQWLEREVQTALDDPQPSVEHAQVAAEWALERAVLAAKANNR